MPYNVGSVIIVYYYVDGVCIYRAKSLKFQLKQWKGTILRNKHSGATKHWADKSICVTLSGATVLNLPNYTDKYSKKNCRRRGTCWHIFRGMKFQQIFADRDPRELWETRPRNSGAPLQSQEQGDPEELCIRPNTGPYFVSNLPNLSGSPPGWSCTPTIPEKTWDFLAIKSRNPQVSHITILSNIVMLRKLVT